MPFLAQVLSLERKCFEKKKKCEHDFDALVLLDGDGQHDPNEIPLLLVPLTNDVADIVIGFRSFGQMPAYRRLGRAVLDRATGGPVRDFQCGFRALNRKAIELLAGTLVKDNFAVESEMTRLANDHDLRFADVEINCKKTFLSESFKNFTKEICFLVKVFAKQKSAFLSTGSFFRKKVSLRLLLVSSLGYCCCSNITRPDISRLRMRCWYRFL